MDALVAKGKRGIASQMVFEALRNHKQARITAYDQSGRELGYIKNLNTNTGSCTLVIYDRLRRFVMI